MSITVKYFARLREQMGKAEEQVDFRSGLSAGEVWRQVSGNGQPAPNVLIAVNMQYAKPEVELKDGDEVAFFPPVTGG
jgi:molybdopterin synthase sulfur carrier subunit